MVEIRVEVHEEDVFVFLVSDGLAHGLKASFGILEGLDVEINRLGRVLSGSVEDSSGLNPRRHGRGLELLLKGSPECRRGGVGLEHRLVISGDLEVDEAPGKLVLLQPLLLVLSLVRLLLIPIYNLIQATHPQKHVHLKLPFEPVVRGQGGDLGSHSGEILGVCGHSGCRGR